MTPRQTDTETDSETPDLTRMTKQQIEDLLTNHKTGVEIVHDGETILAPKPKGIFISRPRVRQQRGSRTLSFRADVGLGDRTYDPAEQSFLDDDVARRVYGDDNEDDPDDGDADDRSNDNDSADTDPDDGANEGRATDESDDDGHESDPRGETDDSDDENGETDDSEDDGDDSDSEKMTLALA